MLVSRLNEPLFGLAVRFRAQEMCQTEMAVLGSLSLIVLMKRTLEFRSCVKVEGRPGLLGSLSLIVLMFSVDVK